MKDVKLIKTTVLTDGVTADQTSTICECSIANNGSQILVTGNWFAAKSLNGGTNWSHISPVSNFPLANGGFCCDQTVLYDATRDLTFWLLQYSERNATNTLRLAVKKGKTLNKEKEWDIWDFTPQGLNPGWTKQWLDYNHAALSDNYLYIGTNVFNTNDVFTRSIILRIPLDNLKSGQRVQPDMVESPRDFSLRCIQGATKTMYFAAHSGTTGNNKLRVYAWPENSLQLTRTDIAITPWSGGDYVAPGPDQTNWLQRADYRITGAWLSKGILGFMWTVNKRGIERPFPHIRVVRIQTSNMTLLDEPDIWSPDFAFGYPDAAPNANGDVGITLFMGGGAKNPTHLVGAYNTTTNKWILKKVREGTNGPRDHKWGDYITVRPFAPGKTDWIAVGYTLQGGKTQSQVEVHTVRFKAT
jgi:hypothetical protein